ncbi:hypothetical protein CDD81_4065 [Ophiocordyceps australis]|uniref:Uncharacterized protein n=1 Tax=Ophiocordyceps australis TaxID=1399860 RepID=A0A2C5XWG2_9HYPO|nr:hypothetical protein CDD81_4065 [Ophiocordyceps australis]
MRQALPLVTAACLLAPGLLAMPQLFDSMHGETIRIPDTMGPYQAVAGQEAEAQPYSKADAFMPDLPDMKHGKKPPSGWLEKVAILPEVEHIANLFDTEAGFLSVLQLMWHEGRPTMESKPEGDFAVAVREMVGGDANYELLVRLMFPEKKPKDMGMAAQRHAPEDAVARLTGLLKKHQSLTTPITLQMDIPEEARDLYDELQKMAQHGGPEPGSERRVQELFQKYSILKTPISLRMNVPAEVRDFVNELKGVANVMEHTTAVVHKREATTSKRATETINVDVTETVKTEATETFVVHTPTSTAEASETTRQVEAPETTRQGEAPETTKQVETPETTKQVEAPETTPRADAPKKTADTTATTTVQVTQTVEVSPVATTNTEATSTLLIESQRRKGGTPLGMTIITTTQTLTEKRTAARKTLAVGFYHIEVPVEKLRPRVKKMTHRLLLAQTSSTSAALETSTQTAQTSSTHVELIGATRPLPKRPETPTATLPDLPLFSTLERVVRRQAPTEGAPGKELPVDETKQELGQELEKQGVRDPLALSRIKEWAEMRVTFKRKRPDPAAPWPTITRNWPLTTLTGGAVKPSVTISMGQTSTQHALVHGDSNSINGESGSGSEHEPTVVPSLLWSDLLRQTPTRVPREALAEPTRRMIEQPSMETSKWRLGFQVTNKRSNRYWATHVPNDNDNDKPAASSTCSAVAVPTSCRVRADDVTEMERRGLKFPEDMADYRTKHYKVTDGLMSIYDRLQESKLCQRHPRRRRIDDKTLARIEDDKMAGKDEGPDWANSGHHPPPSEPGEV